MSERYLYSTVVPVLLDGRRVAGRLSRLLYANYGLESHFFGSKPNLLLRIYTKYHPTPAFSPESDRVILRLLAAFARDRKSLVGIPALVPCSPEAEAFLARAGRELEEYFVLLNRPEENQNPLQGLVQGHEPKG